MSWSLDPVYEINLNDHIGLFGHVHLNNSLILIFAGIECEGKLYTLESNVLDRNTWHKCIYEGNKHTLKGDVSQSDLATKTKETCLIDFFVDEMVAIDPKIKENPSYNARPIVKDEH
jgi:hypothetical protein